VTLTLFILQQLAPLKKPGPRPGFENGGRDVRPTSSTLLQPAPEKKAGFSDRAKTTMVYIYALYCIISNTHKILLLTIYQYDANLCQNINKENGV
jgi:hypothetical protein